MSDYNQCSGLAFRHSSACLGKLIHRSAGVKALCSPAKDPVQNLSSSGAVHVPVSKPDEELPDLRLEDHDKSYHSHVKDRIQKSGHELHVESRHEDADEVERYDRNEYAHGGRTSYPLEENEDEKCQKQYVKDVCKRHLEESKKS